MQILQETQKKFIWIGLNPQIEPIHGRLWSILGMAFTALLSLWIFLIHEARSAQEYMESVYVVSTCSGIFASFASTVFIRKQFFSFFIRVDEFCNGSKWNLNRLNS